MKRQTIGLRIGVAIAAALLFGAPLTAAASDRGQPLKTGAKLNIGGRECVLTRLDMLPLVESDFTRRFHFDSFDNPKLTELRERFKLKEVIAPGEDEFQRQVLLLDWANHALQKFGRPNSSARGALDILAANDAGHTFFCAHYANLLVSAAASLGWVDRSLALRRPNNMGTGSTEHSSTEIWSNQYRKWVLFDPTFAMYVEKDGIPLNAYELRQEWFYHEGKDLVFVIDKERKRYQKSDMPVFRKRYPGFGDLSLDASAVNVYAFIGYIPNTNIMDAGLDYGKMFITQDKICDGTPWHKRVNPADPAHDPYFPIGQSALLLVPDAAGLRVTIKTMTPNFQAFMIRIDGSDWQTSGETFTWKPRPGVNRLEVKTVNRFGVSGPVSSAEVDMGR